MHKLITKYFKTSNPIVPMLNILLILLVILPKNLSTIAGIPVRLSLMALFILVVLDKIYTKEIKLNKKSIKIPVIIYGLFLAFTIPSLFYTLSLITSAYTIVKFLFTFIIFLIVYKLELKKEDFSSIINTIIVATVATMVYGFVQYIFDFNLFKIGAEKYPGAKGRISSTFFNTIYYGVFINFIFAYLLYLYYQVKDKTIRFLMAALMVLIYVSIIVNFTIFTI